MQRSSSSGSSAASSPSREELQARYRRHLLIVGRRGRGKSSLANLIVHGADWPGDLPVSHSMASADTDPKPRVSDDGRYVVYDTTGFDDTVDRSTIIDEIQTIVTTAEGMDGVIFVIDSRRADFLDVAVFELYLQIILSKAPNSAIGVVFTSAPNDIVDSNNINDYLRSEINNGPFVNFRKAVLERCDDNVCFINNPDPSRDGKHKMTSIREQSLQNVHQMIDRLHGKIKFEGVWESFMNRINYWIEHVKANKAQYMSAAISFLVPVLVALATKRS